MCAKRGYIHIRCSCGLMPGKLIMTLDIARQSITDYKNEYVCSDFREQEEFTYEITPRPVSLTLDCPSSQYVLKPQMDTSTSVTCGFSHDSNHRKMNTLCNCKWRANVGTQ